MINIKTLLDNPPQRIGGFTKTIKTAKKKWQIKEVWFHQVCLMDETGEILADVKIGKNTPLWHNQEINIIVGETRDTDKGRILYVDQYSTASVTEPPEMDYSVGEPNEIMGKIRHGLVCADKMAGNKPDKADIQFWTEFIITGK